MTTRVSFTLNGEATEIEADPVINPWRINWRRDIGRP